MALRALQGRVEAGQREPGRGVIEDRAQPVRSAMALLASRREARLLVIRIRGAVVIGLVALDAGAVGDRVGSPGDQGRGVALRALQGRVEAGQREAGGGVIEGATRPIGRVVTILASLREARLHVVRIRGALEIFQVTGHAGGAGQVVGAVRAEGRVMALGAL